MTDWMNQIAIPPRLHDRCRQGVYKAKKARRIRIIAGAAAVFLALCMVTAGGSMAQGIRGFFTDRKRWDGAVTGSIYDPAGGEVTLRVSSADSTGATVECIFDPTYAPWRYLEFLSPDRAEISGMQDIAWTPGALENGRAMIRLQWPDPLPEGEYALCILGLRGEKKADAPLEIRGEWTCSFTVE